ncbi:FHA domain-containing protein [Cellulomonas sp. P5_C5]
MSVPEYTVGDWTAVVRPGFVALLGAGTAESTVRALWQDSGEGVFAALALLARDGFGGLPPFAVVSVDGRRVHAALRGDVEVVVEVDGRQDVWRSGEVSTWTERVLDGVADVVVQADGAPAGSASLPLADGVAAASRVRLALTVRDTADVVPTTAPATNPVGAEPVAAEPVAEEPVAAEPVAEEPVAAEPVAEPPVAVEAVAVEPVAVEPTVAEQAGTTPVAEDLVVPPVVEEEQPTEVASSSAGIVDVAPWETPAQDPDSVPTARLVDIISWDEPTEVELVPVAGTDADDDEDDEVEDEDEADAGPDADRPDPSGVVAAAESFLTSPFSPRGAEPAAAPLPVGGASLDDHDGLTILSTDLAEIREQLPSWASDDLPAPFRTPVVASPPARLVLSTGLVVPLDRAVLLGRAPQVARVTNRELPRLITVPSPQQDISRTHAEVRVEGEHVVVTDLDSTNGIHVSRPGEGARRLHPGEPSVVGTDEVVDLGDGVTFSVERGS